MPTDLCPNYNANEKYGDMKTYEEPGCPTHDSYLHMCPAYNSAEKSEDYKTYEPPGCPTHDSVYEPGCTTYEPPHCPTHDSIERPPGPWTCTADLVADRAADEPDLCPAYNSAEKSEDYKTYEEPGCPTHDSVEYLCPAYNADENYGDYKTYEEPGCPTHNSNDYSGEKTGEKSGYNSGFRSAEGEDCTAHLAGHLADYFSVHVPPCTEHELPEAPEFEEYPGEYPTLTIPTYEEYAGQFPKGEMPTYEEYQAQFPQLTVERYEEYAKEYPGLGDMFELSEAGIRQLMANTGLPVEELMRAYTAEEKAFLDERLPEIREQWSSVGLMRSGMTVAQELKEVGVSARKMATTRAELEKESVIFQRQGLETGIQLAMQHVGMGYEAATDAFRTGQEEYQKAHDSAVDAGKSEYEAKVQGYNAQIDEYVKKFVSSVEAVQFTQGIEERAFETARQEYRKVFDSQVAKGLTEFEAEQAAYEAGQKEYARVQQLEFDKWQTEYVEEMKKYLMQLGFSAQQAAAAASGWGNIFGTIIGIIFQSIFGV